MRAIQQGAGAMVEHPPAWSNDVRRSFDVTDHTADSSPIPDGYCQCGCGQYTGFHERNYPAEGAAKGDPRRYVKGHNLRLMKTPSLDRPAWIEHGDVALIPMCGKAGEGVYAIVDFMDADRVAQHRWNVSGSPIRRYAMAIIEGRGVTMHRLILSPDPAYVVDHIDGDTLNNRRSNLRVCLSSQNALNQRARSGAASRFRGVCRSRQGDRWEARIRAYKRRYYLGVFDTEEEAARAYDAGARRHHGEFARLNFPEEGEQGAA